MLLDKLLLKIKNWHLFSLSSVRGSAFVEFAMVLPFFLLFISLSWDQLADRMSEIRHESVALQLTVNFQDPALKVGINNSGPTPQITLKKLGVTSMNELTGTVANPELGFLSRINLLFNNLMNNIGSFATLVKHNVAAELWYVRVCNGLSTTAPCNVLAPGQAYAAFPAGDGPEYASPAPQRFFTSPGGNECFGAPSSASYINAKQSFDTFVLSKITAIIPGYPATPGTPTAQPFGVKLIDLPASVGGMSAINAYVEYRPLLFLSMCSLPPHMFSNAPVISNHLIFLDGGITL